MKSAFSPMIGRVPCAIFSLLGYLHSRKDRSGNLCDSRQTFMSTKLTTRTIASVAQEKKSEMRMAITPGRFVYL
jgi:hypothetical protein